MTTRKLLETFAREEGIALFNEKKSDEEVYDFLVSKGLTDDFDTFKAEAQKIFTEKVSQMSKDELFAQIEGAELTDEQLEMIAGGAKSAGQTATYIVTGVTGATIGAAAIVFAM